MKIRRKTKDCLNCGLTLNEIYHYCPRCGQENNDQNVSFGMLVQEFFFNYFSLDNKFARSIKPFFIKPGYLTLKFNEGKRASYVHPLRLYLIISVVFFFLSTLWITESLVPLQKSLAPLQSSEDADVTMQRDSALARIDSTVFNKWNMMGEILEDETLSDQEALDSLRSFADVDADLDSFLGKMAFQQFRKVLQKDVDVFVAFVMKNAPIMMFMLLPLFALILKLLYIRSKHLYVNHLIHGIHLHSFTFFLTSLILFISLIFDYDVAFGDWLFFLTLLLIYIYIFLSFKKVYQQGFFKTLFKVVILANFYMFILFFFSLSEAFISFMIF